MKDGHLLFEVTGQRGDAQRKQAGTKPDQAAAATRAVRRANVRIDIGTPNRR